MVGEGPPSPVPINVKEPPLPTGASPGKVLNTGPIASAAGSQDQPHVVPIDATNLPPTAEKIHGVTMDSAFAQVRAWAGHVDVNATAKEIIERINTIREETGQTPLEETDENLALVELAKLEASRKMAEQAKAKLESTAKTSKDEDQQEETHEQITNRISEAWKKGTVLLDAEADANLWDENAQGLSLDDKAIHVAARRTKRIWAEIKIYQGERLQAENKKRQDAGDRPLLPDAQTVFEEQVIGELKSDPSKLKTNQCKYDKASKKYIFYDTDGKTETDQFTQAELTKPVIAGLKNIADQKGPDGKSTPQAVEAQGVLQVLEKYQRGDSFPARTESELAAELAHKEIFETAYQTIAHFLGKDIADALVASSSDKYDITQVLDRIKKNPNMALADLATTIYVYHHGEAKNNPTIQGNIDASLYYQLQGISGGLKNGSPELAAKIDGLKPHEALMEKRFASAKAIVSEFLVSQHVDIRRISNKNILRIVTLSSLFDGQTEIDQKHGIKLKGNANETVMKLMADGFLNEAEVAAITHLANNETGSRVFSSIFGVDVKSFMSGKPGECSNFVIDLLIKHNHLPAEQREIAAQILKNHMAETGLQRLRNLNIPPGAGMGIIMLAMLLPMLQGLMDTGSGGGGEGGHGQQ